MRSGGIVTAEDITDKTWSPVIPDSTGEFMWKYVCGYESKEDLKQIIRNQNK